MTKKYRIVLIITVSLILFVSIALRTPIFSKKEIGVDTYEENIEIINNTDTSIYIFGDNIYFRTDITYKIIDDISLIDSSSKPRVLIINDQLGDCVLSSDDYISIKEKINDGVYFIYIGESKLDKFMELGFYTYIDSEPLLGFATDDLETGGKVGFFTEDDNNNFSKNDELLGSIIADLITEEFDS